MTRLAALLLVLGPFLHACTAASRGPHEPEQPLVSNPPETAAPNAAPDPAAGRQIAASVCGRCHALEGEGPSPHRAAPPFSVLARRYPGDTLAPRLEEGIEAAHPDMPVIRLAPSEIDSFLAYWSSL